MQDRLVDVLTGEEKNYIMPFLWMHGNDSNRACLLIDKMYQSGLRAVCLESRPHPEFLGLGWWHDVGAILKKARQKNMKVWILDDQSFPSGHAAGKISEKDSHLKKWSLVQECIDVAGPLHGTRFAVGKLIERLGPPASAFETESDKKLVAVIACQSDGSRNALLTGKTVDLTENLGKDGFLRWDVPQGAWRIIVITAMTNACAAFNDYVNFLSRESVRFLIDTVYEPHFKHFTQDFGTTIAGFFNDEPGFYTGKHETYPLNEQIGQRDIPLPWSDEVLDLLQKEMPDFREKLPLLWYDGCGCIEFRSFFMDIITTLYQKNYVQQVGDWCEAHGVEYIGHVLEDNNSHARLGCGSGHYFRAMKGQHMAGIDVVFNQIYPGRDFEENCHSIMDGEFNYYALGKLASSISHLEPRMKGRAVAEVFGAGGWGEGLQLMKWVADSLLVRGINEFVPHAYTTKDFPDPDCPPHFYAMGNNPQYPCMGKLYHHMNRAAHLLQGGTPIIHTAILYHAQAEWCGKAMLVQTPAKVCMQNQIDFDFISEDYLLTACVTSQGILIHEQLYHVIIVPEFEYLPARFLEALFFLESLGATIIYINSVPKPIGDLKQETIAHKNIVTPDEMIEMLEKCGCKTIYTQEYSPELRCLHYRQMERDVFFMFYEGLGTKMSVKTWFPIEKELFQYDSMENRLSPLPSEPYNGGVLCNICLNPYESVFIVTNPPEKFISHERQESKMDISLLEPWEVYLEGIDKTIYMNFLQDISIPDLYPDYSGIIEYRNHFFLDKIPSEATLNLGETFECAEVIVNGVQVGIRICPPYQYILDGLLKTGNNEILVRIYTTLFNRLKDDMSLKLPIFPTGMLGPVKIRTVC